MKEGFRRVKVAERLARLKLNNEECLITLKGTKDNERKDKALRTEQGIVQEKVFIKGENRFVMIKDIKEIMIVSRFGVGCWYEIEWEDLK